MEGFGPSRAALLEYSVFDAVRAGCGRVVFIVRESFRDEFEASFVSPLAGLVDVRVVVQEPGALPAGFQAPAGRVKPYGTVQALLAAADVIDRPFIVVNADDFYGLEAISLAASGLASVDAEGVLVSYPLGSTLSEFSPVTRGVCSVDAGWLVAIEEVGGLVAVDAVPSSNGRSFPTDTPTSVNLFGFRPEVIGVLKDEFESFLGSADLSVAELPVSSAVDALLSRGAVRLRVLESSGGWFGVTVREDKPGVDASLARLVESGEYPSSLWDVS